jgi:uncharacterized protein YndB with AHSA1/START domain
MADRNPTTLVADDRSIVISRLIDAPRDLVFEAWTDPKHLSQWWGPNGFSTTTSAFDMRVGGMWRFVMHGPDGKDYRNRITFDSIKRPERLEYHHDDGGDPVLFRTTVTFDDAGGKTRLTMRALFPTKEERDRVIREVGAEEGGHQTIGRLAAYVGAVSAVGEESPVFTITRSFDAPRTLVWRVYSEIEHLPKWWGPKGFTWLAGTLEFRPGGVFHYGMKGPTGQEMWGKFHYREIVPQEKIVFTNSFSDAQGATTRAPFAADWPLEILNTVIFSERNGKTMLAMSGTPINATPAEFARFDAMKPSMNQGFSGTFEQLDAYLAELRK